MDPLEEDSQIFSILPTPPPPLSIPTMQPSLVKNPSQPNMAPPQHLPTPPPNYIPSGPKKASSKMSSIPPPNYSPSPPPNITHAPSKVHSIPPPLCSSSPPSYTPSPPPNGSKKVKAPSYTPAPPKLQVQTDMGEMTSERTSPITPTDNWVAKTPQSKNLKSRSNSCSQHRLNLSDSGENKETPISEDEHKEEKEVQVVSEKLTHSLTIKTNGLGSGLTSPIIPSPHSGTSSPWGSFSEIMTKKFGSTQLSANNTVMELKTGGDISLLQWTWDKDQKHPLLKANPSQGLLHWSNNHNWAVARSNKPLSSNKIFIELERGKGISQLLQIGLCKGPLNFSQSPSKMELSPLTLLGTWISYRIKAVMKGDKIGVLFNLDDKTVRIYKNNTELSHKELPEAFTDTSALNDLYPIVLICGDVELRITETPELERYSDICWSHDIRQQLLAEGRSSREVSVFLEQIGLDKLAKQPKFEKMEMSELVNYNETDLRKMNIPLEQRKRILSSVQKFLHWEENFQDN